MSKRTPLPTGLKCHGCGGSGIAATAWSLIAKCTVCGGSGMVSKAATVAGAPAPPAGIPLGPYEKESDHSFMRRMRDKISEPVEVAPEVEMPRLWVGVPSRPPKQHRASIGSSLSSVIGGMVQLHPNFMSEVSQIGVSSEIMLEYLNDLGVTPYRQDTILVELTDTDPIVIYSTEDLKT